MKRNVLCILVGLQFLLLIFLNFDSKPETKYVEKDRSSNYVLDRWQFLGNRSRLFGVYSAYFDERKDTYDKYDCPIDFICYGTVQIVSILPDKINRAQLYCNYKYSSGNITKKVKPLEIRFITDRCSHDTFIIVCVLSHNIHQPFETPEAVGLSYEGEKSMVNPTVFTYIRYPTAFDPSVKTNNQINDIAICVNDLFGFGNTLRLVEFVELYKILGVSRFYFYNFTVSKEVSKVFDYYKSNENFNFKVFDWNVLEYNGSQHIFYYGISACFSDCYFRASFVDNVKYVFLHDVDEIIFPRMKGVTTLPDLMKKLDTNKLINSFNVRSAYTKVAFYLYKPDKSNTFTNKKLYTQLGDRRSPAEMHHDRSKVIGKGKSLHLLSNHLYYNAIKNTVERRVQSEEALVYHYRDYWPIYGMNITDTTALKYGNQLRVMVDNVCKKLFANGICAIDTFDKSIKIPKSL